MKVILLAVALSTALTALPTTRNMFVAEHESNTTIYTIVPQAMMIIGGALLIGKNLHSVKQMGPFIKAATRTPKHGMGKCCICLEGNLEDPSKDDPSEKIPVIFLHGLEECMKSHGCCANCLKAHIQTSGKRHPIYGRKPVACPTGCKRKIKIESPIIQEVLNG